MRLQKVHTKNFCLLQLLTKRLKMKTRAKITITCWITLRSTIATTMPTTVGGWHPKWTSG
uniref:Uncharacterized protein n=1 Tax=Anguilla anguilla TaxID=7936 RepID=A0A0E9WQT3_ANGAN